MLSLSAGLDYVKYDVSQTDDVAKTSMEDKAIYITGKLRFLEEKLIFSASGRYDKYTNDGNLISSSKDDNFGGAVGVAWLPVNWLKFRANYAEGFRMPTPNQVGGDMKYDNPNPGLLPEKSKTYEFGADVNWNYINGALTYFHSDWENKIVRIGVKGMPRSYQWQNIKDATLAGFEGSFSADVGKAFRQNYSLSPYVSFTWLRTRKNKDPSQFIAYHDNDVLVNTPEWMISYGLNYAHPGYKIKSRLNANYYGSTITSHSTSRTGYFRRPSGTVLNLSVEKELADLGDRFGRLTLRGEINNLTNSANEMYWSYPGQARSFYVGLRYDFN
jgi:vitamin B12 transporter